MNKQGFVFDLQRFATGGTTFEDVIVPELFTPYAIKRSMELSALVQSGIIVNDSAFDTLASQAAPTVNMPFFADLTGESEQIVEGKNLTANKITSNKDVAVILRRVMSWSSTELAAALAGKDPMQAIVQLVASFWAKDMQRELVALLTGVFGTYTPTGGTATTRLASNLLDISSMSGAAAKWSASAFIDAMQLLGDAKSQLTAVCMHSATESALRKQNLIETVQPSNDVAFGTYQGKRVIVDDGCPVKDGVHTTYLFGEGAIALGNGNPVGFVATETDREKRKGSGVNHLINRKTYILHPRGVKWTGESIEKVEGPSRDELRKPENWTPVYEAKQIRIVAFKHKL